MTDQVQELTHTSEELQKAGDYLGAFKAVREALRLSKDMYGVDSEPVTQLSGRLCELCNSLGMSYLERSDFPLALDMLRKAEVLAEANEYSRAVTLNNLACYYRRIGKTRTALKFLERALKLGVESVDAHLNICAVLSQMGKHTQAVEHAMQAVILLQEQTIDRLTNSTTEDRSSVLAIAFHNLAVEFEFLSRFPEALKYYNKAVLFAKKHLPPDHKLIPNLQAVLETATEASSKRR